MNELTEYEIEMLHVLNDERPDFKWGAWCTPCLEYLAGRGLCTRGLHYRITEAGKEKLKELTAGALD